MKLFSLMSLRIKKSHDMSKLVRISWYRRLNGKCVHINETFKVYDSYCMTLLEKRQYVNRKCASTYSEVVSLLIIWYKNNAINFLICQCNVPILFMISIRFQKGDICYTKIFWEVCTKDCGFDDMFTPDGPASLVWFGCWVRVVLLHVITFYFPFF